MLHGEKYVKNVDVSYKICLTFKGFLSVLCMGFANLHIPRNCQIASYLRPTQMPHVLNDMW